MVTDTGGGIDPKAKEKLFVLFGRASTNIKNHRHTSIGLGLSFCKGVLERMNGAISCTSEVDKGTSFIINLKLKAPKDDIGLTKSQHKDFMKKLSGLGQYISQLETIDKKLHC